MDLPHGDREPYGWCEMSHWARTDVFPNDMDCLMLSCMPRGEKTGCLLTRADARAYSYSACRLRPEKPGPRFTTRRDGKHQPTNECTKKLERLAERGVVY
jgi:hypothetical protein